MEGRLACGSKQLTDTDVQANAPIPILDTSAVIAGRPGAVDALGAELRTALQDIGFEVGAGPDECVFGLRGDVGGEEERDVVVCEAQDD